MRAVLARLHNTTVNRRWMIALACVGLLLIAAQGALVLVARQQIADINRELDDLLTYPAKAVVCDDAMDATCAREAANRAGFAVAWIDPTELGMRHKATVALVRPEGQGFAFQDVAGSRVGVTIASNEREEPAGERIGSVRTPGRTGELWRDEVDEFDDFFTVVWRESGTRYSLSVFGKLQIPYEPAMRDDAEAIFRHVRLTYP